MLKIKDGVDLKELEKYLLKLNIMDEEKTLYKNVYCCVSEFNKDEIKNDRIEDYNVEFFINKKREIDYCTYPECRDETKILDKIYDLIQAGLVEKVEDKQ